MSEAVNNALNNVDMVYDELIQIANETVESIVGDISSIIRDIQSDLENMNNDLLRDYILKLCLKSYSFSDIKEKAAFKAEIAETIRKEAYAKQFNSTEGTVAVRQNNAEIAISAEYLSEEIYQLISALLKTKADEIHRVVDALKTVLMSRLQEAKISITGV